MSRNLSQQWKPPYSLPHYVTLFDERRLIQQPPRAITNWRINHPLAEDVEGTSAARCWSMVTPLHPLRWALPPLLPGVGQWLSPSPSQVSTATVAARCWSMVVSFTLSRWALPPLLPGVGQWLSPSLFQVSIATIVARWWSMVTPPSPSQVSTATVVARCWSMVTPSTLSGEHCHRCCKVLVNGWIG